MQGTFFLITRPESGAVVWLGILDEESKHFWVYDFETKAFHQKRGLALDYTINHDLDYRPISVAEAVAITKGKYPAIPKQVRDLHKADERAVPAAEVLGEGVAPRQAQGEDAEQSGPA